MRKKQIRKLKTGEIKELDLGGVAGRGGGNGSMRRERRWAELKKKRWSDKNTEWVQRTHSYVKSRQNRANVFSGGSLRKKWKVSLYFLGNIFDWNLTCCLYSFFLGLIWGRIFFCSKNLFVRSIIIFLYPTAYLLYLCSLLATNASEDKALAFSG